MYEGTITFIQVDDKGIDRNRKESYVLENAISFSDAEDKLLDYGEGLTAIDVASIKRSKVKEIINTRKSDEEMIFAAELQDVFLNEDGTEKEIKYKVLLFAKTFDEAKAIMSEHIRQGYSMEIVSIKKTKFDDVLY